MEMNYRTQRVDVDQFQLLALSRQTLIRADDHGNDERGLLDPKQRIRYVVQKSQLLNWLRHDSSVALRSC